MMLATEMMQSSGRAGLDRAATIADFSAIYEPEVQGLILSRELATALVREAHELAFGDSYRYEFTVPATALGSIRRALTRMPHLAADVAHWAEVLVELTGCQAVGVRVARIIDAMCPLFHVDYVTVRLVTTYVGAATELLERGNGAIRHAIDRSTGRATDLVDEALVFRAALGDVVLMKGGRWPGNEAKGCLHRSPHACADEPRLVLTLDPIYD
jgi:Protein of unknown function (DUF1826)